MINIKKEKTERDYYKITLENEFGFFIIEFCGNLDLYWNYYPKKEKLSEIETPRVLVPKSSPKNLFIYLNTSLQVLLVSLIFHT